MKTIVLAALCLSAVPLPAVAQVPRDTPPPAIEQARRERDLRALIEAHPNEPINYLTLAKLYEDSGRYADAEALLTKVHEVKPDDPALLLAAAGFHNRQGNFARTIDALEKAAALEPDRPEGYHRVATFYWEKANRDDRLSNAEKRDYIRKGLAMEDKALALNPGYMEAMTYKNILLRMQANTVQDPAERASLIAEADALRDRVIQMQKQAQKQGQPAPTPAGAPAPPPPPFIGFSEQYADTVTRLAPLRVGGAVGQVRQPTKIKDVKPVYPAAAQTAGVQGIVIVEAVIDESGSVANARVLRSIPLLDEAALSAVSRWQFAETTMNGRPISVLVTVTVNFSLQ